MLPKPSLPPALPFAAVLCAALLLAAVPAAAQPPTFSEAYQVRGALGDIPTTATVEEAGWWNLELRLAVRFDNASDAQHTIPVPAAAQVVNATCTPCNPTQATVAAGSVTFTLPAAQPSGDYTLTVHARQAAGLAFAFSIEPPAGVPEEDRVAILYVPRDYALSAPYPSSSPGLSTDGSARIHVFDAFHDPLWVAIHAGEAAGAGATADRFDDDVVWWFLALGLVAGAVLWSLLVAKGLVQARSRRQVAGTAAHVEAAAEPPAVLEGKKRALLAALKDIEVARMNNEMPAEVYDAVKADLKRQAVTVMRALEASQPADDAKA